MTRERGLLGRVGAKRAAGVVLMGAAVIALEIFLVFINRQGDFRIEGQDVLDLNAFGAGAVVSHSFLMRGDGLNSVAVQFGSDSWVTTRVQWTLWRGTVERPEEMTRAFEGSEAVDLRPGHQWRTFSFTRDASSRDRWYTIELRALSVERVIPSSGETASLPRVALSASNDNPERGGVLFVNGAQRPGSLLMRAGRQGRTVYRRFVAEVEPNLPSPFRNPVVQWGIVAVIHWAFLVFVWAVVGGVDRAASPPAQT